MDHFYVTLPSDSSGYYFPYNTTANFITNLAIPIKLEPNKWDVGLVVISYRKGYKKRLLHNTIRLDSMEINFRVKHYECLMIFSRNYPNFSNRLKCNNLSVYIAST